MGNRPVVLETYVPDSTDDLHRPGSAADVTSHEMARSRTIHPDVEVVAPELSQNRIPGELAGRWRIVEMEVWDSDAIDLMGPAFIEFRRPGGSLRFIAVEGGLDCRYGEVGGRPSVEFSWVGADDRDAACGRGWAHLQEDGSLSGRIFIHDGDDSSFTATRAQAKK